MPTTSGDSQFGSFRLSPRERRLLQNGQEIPLTPKAFDTLHYLVSHPGQLVEKQDLMKAVWGDVFVDDSTLTQNIFTLRNALGDREFIETVPRRGYRFTAQVTALEPEPVPAPPSGRGIPKLWIAAALGIALVLIAWISLRSPYNPLEGAPSWTRITNDPGDELDGIISRDAKFIGYVSDHSGAFDIMMNEVATQTSSLWSKGGFTEGSRNQIMNMGFTPTGAVWNRPFPPGGDDTRSGPLQITPFLQKSDSLPFLEPVVSSMPAWSPDGKRVVYINNGGGDSMFLTDGDGLAKPVKIFGDGNPGMHNHAMVWSLDGEWIYFTRGQLGTPANFEIWRIRPTGQDAEQLTHLHSDIAYLCIVDDGTVLYLARDAQGFGPWLWALDVESRNSVRIPNGTDEFFSLAASAPARRLVATIGHASANLWTVPILENRVATDADVKAFDVHQSRALTPRFTHEPDAAESFFFLSSSGGADGLWQYRNGKSTELWNGSTGPLVDPPVVSRDGKQIAVLLPRNGKKVWHSVTAWGSTRQPIGETLEIIGSATWNPEGTALLTGAKGPDGQPGLFLIPVDGSAPSRFLPGDARNPIWSADLGLIVYTGPSVKGSAPLRLIKGNHVQVQVPNVSVNGSSLQSGVFLPDGKTLVYRFQQNFFRLDLKRMQPDPLTQLTAPAAVESFDVTPDGKHIVFDRFRRNSDIWMNEVPAKAWYRDIF